MLRTLYIIGNGFDRYHGLDTRYQSFAFYLQDHYSQIHDYLVNYYGLPYLDRKDEASFREPLWAEFEKSLAELNFDTVLDDNTDYLANPGDPEFRDRDWHAYQIQMEMIVDDLTTNLFSSFKEFIKNVLIPKSISDKELCLNRNSLFLNFNYTDTLEHFYKISEERITYIHNKANNDKSVLVLGHCINPENFKIEEPKPPKELTDEQYDLWKDEMAEKYDYSYETGKQELMTYFTKSFKQSEKIIQEFAAFFNDIKRIDNVVIIGHSLSDVDKPYFIKIFNSVRKRKSLWTVSYYNDPEKETHKRTLLSLGLSEKQINLVKMDYFKHSFCNCFILPMKILIKILKLKVN